MYIPILKSHSFRKGSILRIKPTIGNLSNTQVGRCWDFKEQFSKCYMTLFWSYLKVVSCFVRNISMRIAYRHRCLSRSQTFVLSIVQHFIIIARDILCNRWYHCYSCYFFLMKPWNRRFDARDQSSHEIVCWDFRVIVTGVHILKLALILELRHAVNLMLVTIPCSTLTSVHRIWMFWDEPTKMFQIAIIPEIPLKLRSRADEYQQNIETAATLSAKIS